MNKQLEQEAEEYKKNWNVVNGAEIRTELYNAFIAGANSNYVQKKIVEAQIELCNNLIEYYQNSSDIDDQLLFTIKELQQQLKELEHETNKYEKTRRYTPR